MYSTVQYRRRRSAGTEATEAAVGVRESEAANFLLLLRDAPPSSGLC